MRLITQELSRSQFAHRRPHALLDKPTPLTPLERKCPVFARARKKANFFGSLNFT